MFINTIYPLITAERQSGNLSLLVTSRKRSRSPSPCTQPCINLHNLLLSEKKSLTESDFCAAQNKKPPRSWKCRRRYHCKLQNYLMTLALVLTVCVTVSSFWWRFFPIPRNSGWLRCMHRYTTKPSFQAHYSRGRPALLVGAASLPVESRLSALPLAPY